MLGATIFFDALGTLTFVIGCLRAVRG